MLHHFVNTREDGARGGSPKVRIHAIELWPTYRLRGENVCFVLKEAEAQHRGLSLTSASWLKMAERFFRARPPWG
jgi:hypothetical protein